MITGSASRDAKYSIIAMFFLGVAMSISLFYMFDRWLLSGLYTEKIVDACQALGASCQNAFLSIEWTPLVAVLVLGVGALVFAVIRAVVVLFSSKKCWPTIF